MNDLPPSEPITRDRIIAEVQAWARRIGVEHHLHSIHLRPLRRKWASVSSQGRLTLSRDLLAAPAIFRREVIVHELVHLKLAHGKHSALFRSLVRAYLAEADEG